MNIRLQPTFQLSWLRPLSFLLLLWVSSGGAESIESGLRHVDYPDWFHQGLIDLEAELEAADAAGKHGVMVLFTTQGCTYCSAFINKSLGNQQIAARLQQQFISIGLEIFDDSEMTDHAGKDMPVKLFAQSQQAGMAPTLLFYALNDDHQGELIYRAIGYQAPARFNSMLDYLVGGYHHNMAFRDYLATDAATDTAKLENLYPLKDDVLFMPAPHLLDRSQAAAAKPLFVLFEAPGCQPCADYHELVLANQTIRTLLGGFDVVRLDAKDRVQTIVTPAGQRVSAAEWFQQEDFSRLPALMFFDETGQQVLTTDALVELNRMTNSIGLVLDRAYQQGWSYQRYARSKSIEENNKKALKAAQ